MFAISEMVKSILGSERSQRKLSPPTDSIKMHMGEPDFPTPMHIQEAATRAMRDGFTHYGNAFGDPQLREAVCMSLERDYGVETSPDHVLVTAGGIEAIHIISATYLNPGNEVLVADPGYSAYADSVTLFGGRPVPVPLTDRFHLDLDGLREAVTDKTKMVFLSNPGNPTGAVFSKEEIRGIATIAAERDLLLVVDEVYHKLLYGGIRHFSICEVEDVKDRAILVNSFSKTYAMTGWRVGYLVAHPAIVKDLVRFHKALVICANTVAQKASVAALTGPQDSVEAMRTEYNERRLLVEKALNGIAGVQTQPCEGAFYLFPRFEHRVTSKEMTSYLSEKGVLVRSGTEFGERGESHVRLSFTTTSEELERGMERFKRALDDIE